MCLLVIIASRTHRDLRAACAAHPLLHAGALDASESAELDDGAAVRSAAQVTPTDGCGCDFAYETEAGLRAENESDLGHAPDDVQREYLQTALDRRAHSVAAINALRELIGQLLADGHDVTIHTSWCELSPPDERHAVDPAFFGGESFGFAQSARYDVTPS